MIDQQLLPMMAGKNKHSQLGMVKWVLRFLVSSERRESNTTKKLFGQVDRVPTVPTIMEETIKNGIKF